MKAFTQKIIVMSMLSIGVITPVLYASEPIKVSAHDQASKVWDAINRVAEVYFDSEKTASNNTSQVSTIALNSLVQEARAVFEATENLSEEETTLFRELLVSFTAPQCDHRGQRVLDEDGTQHTESLNIGAITAILSLREKALNIANSITPNNNLLDFVIARKELHVLNAYLEMTLQKVEAKNNKFMVNIASLQSMLTDVFYECTDYCMFVQLWLKEYFYHKHNEEQSALSDLLSNEGCAFRKNRKQAQHDRNQSQLEVSLKAIESERISSISSIIEFMLHGFLKQSRSENLFAQLPNSDICFEVLKIVVCIGLATDALSGNISVEQCGRFMLEYIEATGFDRCEKAQDFELWLTANKEKPYDVTPVYKKYGITTLMGEMISSAEQEFEKSYSVIVDALISYDSGKLLSEFRKAAHPVLKEFYRSLHKGRSEFLFVKKPEVAPQVLTEKEPLTSRRFSNALESLTPSTIPFVSQAVRLDRDVHIQANQTLVPIDEAQTGQRITLTSYVPREVRLAAGVTLDLSVFGANQLVLGENITLVLEAGASIRGAFAATDKEQNIPTLYVNGNSQLVFEGREKSLESPYESDSRTSLKGCLRIWLNKQAVCRIAEHALVSVEADDHSARTDVTFSLHRSARMLVGTQMSAGGGLQVGNSRSSQAVRQINCAIVVDGVDAQFIIGRRGFVGVGCGVTHKNGARQGVTPWQFAPLHNVRNMSILVKSGLFQHNVLADPSSSEASLLALGAVAGRYTLHLGNESKTLVRGGGAVAYINQENQALYSVFAPSQSTRKHHGLGRAEVQKKGSEYLLIAPEQEFYFGITATDFAQFPREQYVAAGLCDGVPTAAYIFNGEVKHTPLKRVRDQNGSEVSLVDAVARGVLSVDGALETGEPTLFTL